LSLIFCSYPTNDEKFVKKPEDKNAKEGEDGGEIRLKSEMTLLNGCTGKVLTQFRIQLCFIMEFSVPQSSSVASLAPASSSLPLGSW